MDGNTVVVSAHAEPLWYGVFEKIYAPRKRLSLKGTLLPANGYMGGGLRPGLRPASRPAPALASAPSGRPPRWGHDPPADGHGIATRRDAPTHGLPSASRRHRSAHPTGGSRRPVRRTEPAPVPSARRVATHERWASRRVSVAKHSRDATADILCPTIARTERGRHCVGPRGVCHGMPHPRRMAPAQDRVFVRSRRSVT